MKKLKIVAAAMVLLGLATLALYLRWFGVLKLLMLVVMLVVQIINRPRRPKRMGLLWFLGATVKRHSTRAGPYR